MPTPSFDQARYWSARGDRYRAEFAAQSDETNQKFRQQEAELGAILDTYDLSQVRSVLEIGCGFGRLTPMLLAHLPALERYVGLDVSEGQVAAAREAAAGWAVPSVDFQVADFRRPPPGEAFDLVFAGEVFLHFPPDQIEEVIEHAFRLSTQWLLHVDPYWPPIVKRPLAWARWLATRARTGQSLHETNWIHDFPRLYPTSTVTLHPVLGAIQHLFVVRR